MHYSLWWSNGSERIAPCLLVCPGLPDAERFTALLAGDWSQRSWGEKPLFAEDKPANLPPTEDSL